MEALINLGYMVAVILLTTIALTYIVRASNLKKTNDRRRVITTFVCGLILAPVWYFLLKADIGQLIISLLAAMTFYSLIKRFIWNGFDKLYNNGKGVV